MTTSGGGATSLGPATAIRKPKRPTDLPRGSDGVRPKSVITTGPGSGSENTVNIGGKIVELFPRVPVKSGNTGGVTTPPAQTPIDTTVTQQPGAKPAGGSLMTGGVSVGTSGVDRVGDRGRLRRKSSLIGGA